MFTRCPTCGRKKIACIHGLRSEGVNVDSETRPVVMPPRRVPIAIKPKLKDELQRLEELDVIEKVTGPTDWVSSLVTVVKPSGKLRLCIDPQQLNMALKREHYPLPVIEDVLPQLAKVKVFSKADLKEGFLQCKLDDESACLTTFQTPCSPGISFLKGQGHFVLSKSTSIRISQCLGEHLERAPRPRPGQQRPWPLWPP